MEHKTESMELTRGDLTSRGREELGMGRGERVQRRRRSSTERRNRMSAVAMAGSFSGFLEGFEKETMLSKEDCMGRACPSKAHCMAIL